MTKEQLEAAKNLEKQISNTGARLVELQNGCDVSIGGAYQKTSDPAVYEAMRGAAINVLAERLRDLQKAMSAL